MWASQPKAHKAISPTLHTQPCYTSAFLGHLSWWVLLRTTVRSRCQARTRHFPPSLPEEGPGFRAPFPPTRAGGKKSIAAGLHYPQSTVISSSFFVKSPHVMVLALLLDALRNFPFPDQIPRFLRVDLSFCNQRKLNEKTLKDVLKVQRLPLEEGHNG